MRRCIGIDFGTTNTIISFRDGKGKLKKMGGKSIPSAIYFKSKKSYVVGQEALDQAEQGNKEALITGFKANIKGERYVITAENGETVRLKPAVVSRYFLNKILTDHIQKRFLKIFGDGELTAEDRVVITVPVKFNPEEKQAIKKAATEAYYPNVRLAFEPTAAAIASSVDVQDPVITVYDFGGGTFDVSIIQKNAQGVFEPVEQGGDKKLGGNALSRKIMEKILVAALEEEGIAFPADEEEFDEEEYGMSEVEFRRSFSAIMDTAEEIKIVFSEHEESEEELFRYQIYYNDTWQDFELAVSRQQFEECIKTLVMETVQITREVVDRAMREQNVAIHTIIMAGGSSQLPLAQRLLRQEFQKDGIEIAINDDVFDLISKGALELAEQENSIAIQEKTEVQLGIAEQTGLGTLNFETIIDCNQSLPVAGQKEYRITEKMLKVGQLHIKCYERDVKAYPKANRIPEDIGNGINFIEEYAIDIKPELRPDRIQVRFSIEEDGTLTLGWEVYDVSGGVLEHADNRIQVDSDLE